MSLPTPPRRSGPRPTRSDTNCATFARRFKNAAPGRDGAAGRDADWLLNMNSLPLPAERYVNWFLSVGSELNCVEFSVGQDLLITKQISVGQDHYY